MKKLLVFCAFLFFLVGQSGNKKQADDMIGLMLNANGLLCAEVVSVTPLRQKNVYEVECIQYRGGKTHKTYIFDVNTGKAYSQ